MSNSGAGAITDSVFALPPAVWLWAGLTLLLAIGTGFAAGVWYGRTSVRSSVDRAARKLSKLFGLVMETLDTAQHACTVLQSCPQFALTPGQAETLDAKRQKLAETFTAIAIRYEAQAPAEARPRAEIQMAWSRTSEDPETGLPDRAATQANIEMLQRAVTHDNGAGGLLLVRVDRYRQLVRRFGANDRRSLLKGLASVLCRTIRDEDLVGRYAEDVFTVLMPNVDEPAGRQLAETLRNAVRHHRFRLDAAGPEVLLTASFGFATCRAGETAELLVNRAADAVSTSQRLGRNQLHIDNGIALSCAAAG